MPRVEVEPPDLIFAICLAYLTWQMLLSFLDALKSDCGVGFRIYRIASRANP